MMIKRNLASIGWVLLVLIAFPGLAWAEGFTFASPAEDKSIFYLGQIFGNVGTTLQGSGSAIIKDMFRSFNIAVLSLGSIVVSYTIVLSTINTAQEGEVMGRKWSSVWIPLRAAIGMGFLLPTSSGYSLIQVLMMQVIIYGIGAANQIWSKALDISFGGAGMGAVQITGTPTEKGRAVRNLMLSVVCQETLNTAPACKTALNNKLIIRKVAPVGSAVVMTFGTADASYSNICGSMTSGTSSGIAVEQNVWLTANSTVMNAAAESFLGVAQDLALGNTPDANFYASAANTATSQIESGLGGVTTKNVTPDQSAAVKNGWLFAGSYYFELIKVRNKPIFSFPTASGTNSSGTTIGTDCSTILGSNMNKAIETIPYGAGRGTDTSSSSPPGNMTLEMQRSNVSSNAGPLYDIIADAVKSATVDIMNVLTKAKGLDDNGNLIDLDPISSMRNLGSSIMTTCENIWFGIILAAFIMMILGCIMSGVNPICFALGAIITVLVPVLTLIIGLLWGAGAAIGIYLPMVPYLVFTFTALGWMLLVIETMAAAPIVALGLVSPAQENLGKASAAVMLITNVFLRPSLMVIGFVIAVKLVTVAITMVNFGFMATINASTGNIGIFGCIALLCLYGGLCIGIIHECFSLVYELPNKITRWIGGQAESGGNIKEQLSEAKGAVDKGAEIGGGLMKSSAGAMAKTAKQGMGGGGISDIAGG